MRSAWNTEIRLGLVSIPVRCYTAVSSSREFQLFMTHKDCGQDIKFQRYCPVHGPVDRWQIEKVARVKRGRESVSVPVTDEDLTLIRGSRDMPVEIIGFPRMTEIDPILLSGTSYHLAPGAPNGSLGALRKAMKKSGRVGFARLASFNRDKYGVLRPQSSSVCLHILESHEKMRAENWVLESKKEAELFGKDESLCTTAYVDSLVSIIGEHSMSSFDYEDYPNTHMETLNEIVEDKIANGNLSARKKKKTSKVIDFAQALREMTG